MREQVLHGVEQGLGQHRPGENRVGASRRCVGEVAAVVSPVITTIGTWAVVPSFLRSSHSINPPNPSKRVSLMTTSGCSEIALASASGPPDAPTTRQRCR